MAVAIIILVGGVVWWRPAVSTFFYADDWGHFQLALLTNFRVAPDVLWPWVRASRPFGRHFISTLHSLFGLTAAPYHIVQLVVHLLSSVLLFAVARRLLGSNVGGFISALIFLFSRFAYWSVSWVGAAFDLLVAFFFLATLAAYQKSSGSEGIAEWLWFALTVVSFNLGLKSKENVLVLPLMLIVYSLLFGRLRNFWSRRSDDRWPVWGRVSRSEVTKLGIVVIQALVFYRFNAFGPEPPNAPYHVSFAPHVILRSFGWYLDQLVFFGIFNEFGGATPALSTTLLFISAFLAALVFAARTRNRALVFGWLTLWFGLLPTAVLPNHFDYGLYIYLPMIGFAISVGSLVTWVSRNSGSICQRRAPIVLTSSITLFIIGSILWTYIYSSKFTANVSQRDRQMMYSLSTAVPVLNGPAHLILLGPDKMGPFEYGPGVAARVWYRNLDLAVHFADNEDQVADLVTEAGGDVYVLRWEDDHFVRLVRKFD